MTRARQTAGIIREYLDAPVVERRDLIEHGTHALIENCSIQEAIRLHPNKLDSNGKCIYVQGPRPGLNWDFSCGGEDLRALHARARGAYESMLTEHRNDSGAFMVVAHGSFLSAFLSEALEMPLRSVWNFAFENCGCMRLKFHSDRDQVWASLAAEGPSE
jgi:broad specificity phosphatase PhoE